MCKVWYKHELFWRYSGVSAQNCPMAIWKFKMATILHLEWGLVLNIIKSADLNDFGVHLYVLEATGIISCSFVSIWKSQMVPFFKMAAILHNKMVLVIEEKSVGRFEWSWCHFSCFKGCWNHILQLCSHLTCHSLKMMSQALQLNISWNWVAPLA